MAKDLALERAWRQRVAGQAKSGLTVRAFCEREGLVVHQFTWWRRQVRIRDGQAKATKKKPAGPARPKRRRSQRPTPRERFVPVELRHADLSSASIEIVLDRPPRIAVSTGFDPRLLRDVLRALGNEPC